MKNHVLGKIVEVCSRKGFVNQFEYLVPGKLSLIYLLGKFLEAAGKLLPISLNI